MAFDKKEWTKKYNNSEKAKKATTFMKI